MGRAIKRVALGFDFPLDASFADHIHEKHGRTCKGDANGDHDECLPDWEDAIPKGEGWQLWQTVSDGPITPVFATAEELIDFMCEPSRHSDDRGNPYPDMPGGQGWRREIAEPFVRRQGSAPSFVGIPGRGLISGAEAVVMAEAKKRR
jgi:hypothetical protein